MPTLLPPDALCKMVAERQQGKVLMGWSRGKDSIGTLLQLRRHFAEIHLFYIADIPGLRFIEEDLKRAEDFFGLPIDRYVSPYFFGLINQHIFTAPDVAEELSTLKLYRDLEGQDIDAEVRKVHGLPENTLVACGLRVTDSLQRRQFFKRLPNNFYRAKGWHWFFPVWNWTDNDLERQLSASGFKLPVDYKLFGRSFEGIGHRFLEPLREACPDDYARVLKFFPLARLDTYRRTIR